MAPSYKVTPIVIAAIPAVLLGLLSIPSLVASVIALPSDSVVERIRSGKTPDGEEIVRAAQLNERAAHIFESGRYRANVAGALLRLPPPQRRAAEIGLDAETAVRQSLAVAPASPHNWVRLTYLRLLRADRAGARKAWQMSVLTGRYVPGLMRARLLIGFSMFPITDRAMIDLLDDQVRLMAQANSMELARAVRQGGAEPFVRAVLWSDRTLSAPFEQAYSKLLTEERSGT